MPNEKKYLIQIDGIEGQSVKDSAWWNDYKDDLHKNYNPTVFEISDYDENDTLDTDQYMISINGMDGSSVKDAAWWNDYKDDFMSKYGDKAVVKRVRYVDYWYDKANDDKAAIASREKEIDDLRKQQSSTQRWTPEYNEFEKQISDKQMQIINYEESYKNNPRVVEAEKAYAEEYAAAQEEYDKNYPNLLKQELQEAKESRAKKRYAPDVFPSLAKDKKIDIDLDENSKFKLDKEDRQSNAERKLEIPEELQKEVRKDLQANTALSKQEIDDIVSGKTNIPIESSENLDSAQHFIDAYDYLVNNKSSIAQGIWYSVWEDVNKNDIDNVYNVLKKLEDEFGNINDVSDEQIASALSESEAILLKTYFLLSEEEQNVSGAFKGGEIAGESIKIAGEMALWSAITALTSGAAAPAAGAAMSVSLGGKVLKIGQKLLSALGKWSIKSGMTGLAKGGLKAVGGLTKAVGKYALKSAPFTLLAPTTYKHVSEKQLQIDDDGRLMDSRADVAKYFMEDWIENFTEFSGEGFADLFKYIGKGVSKFPGIGKLATAIGDSGFGNKMKWLYNTKGVQALKNLGFHGMPAEILEELEGAVLNELAGFDDEAIENFFDKDNLGTMLIGFAPMTLFGAGVSTVSMASAVRNLSKSEKALMTALSSTMSEEKISSMQSEIMEAKTAGEISEIYKKYTKGAKLTKEQVATMLKYGENAARYNTLLANREDLNVDEVKSINSPYDIGFSMTEGDLYDVNEAEQAARQAVIDTGIFDESGETEESANEFLDMSSIDLFQFIEDNKSNLTEEQTLAINQLATAKSISEGLNDRLSLGMEAAIANSLKISNDASENGFITVGIHGVVTDGVYKEEAVYVKGNVKINNGTISNTSAMGSFPVEVVNVATGEVKIVDANELHGLSKESIEDFNSKLTSAAKSTYAGRWNEQMNTKSSASKLRDVEQYVGQKVYIDTPNGGMSEVEIQQILPNGEVLIKGKKGDLGGQSTIRMKADELYDSISRDSNGNIITVEQTQQAPVVEDTQDSVEPVTDFRGETFNIILNNTPVEVEVLSQDDSSKTVRYQYKDANNRTKIGSSTIAEFESAMKQYEESVSQQNNTPVEETTENETINEDPVNETQAEDIDWDALYESDKNAYLAELQKEFGEEAIDVLKEEIADAQKKIKKLSNKETKTQAERIKNRKEKKRLQERINELNGMIEKLSPSELSLFNEELEPNKELQSEETPVAETHETTKPAVLNGVVLEEPKRTEVKRPRGVKPINAAELAAQELSSNTVNGGIKLTKESFFKHTGYGVEDANAFKGIFRLAENGGMSLEEAGERLMEIDSEYGYNLLDHNDPMAGVNAILEAIGANRTMSDLRSYAARNRQAELQKEADALYGYLYEQYEQMLDEVHRNEIFGEELEAVTALTEEEYNELNAIFAEETIDYGTEHIEGESDTLHETEDFGDLPVAEGEVSGAVEGSNQVLQEAQPVHTRGEGSAEGSGAGNEVSGENADSSVLNGSSSTEELVSSIEGDMPDFTGAEYKAPSAPKAVADPIAEAQKREKSLVSQLERPEIGHTQKQDLAYNAGRAVADMFATRAEYEAYEEVAADLGDYIEDFDRGVEESFASRKQYQIGNLAISESEATKLATDVVMQSIANANIEAVVVTNEQVLQVIESQKAKDSDFFGTSDGTVYGWTDGKKIYLTSAGINPNTPIHEYTHLWANAMMRKNAEGWNSVKSLLKNTPVWKEVMNDSNYGNIHNNEDLVASEVLSRISGEQNAAKLEEVAQKMVNEAKGTMRKAEARGLIQNIKDALNKFWNWVGTELFGIKKFESVSQVTDRVLWDFVNNTELADAVNNISSVNQPKTKEGAISDADLGITSTPTQIQFSISKNNQQLIDKWLGARTDLSENERRAFMLYINDREPKQQLAMARWIARGMMRIPEDLSIVDQAFTLANKMKVDPMTFETPAAIVKEYNDRFGETKNSGTTDYLSPDDARFNGILTNKTDMGNGIVVYDVQNDMTGRDAVREIMNDHLGKEFNCWCLLYANAEGVATANSEQMWWSYNGTQKKVAFKDGVICAFCASTGKSSEWWDLQDISHGKNIPFESKIEGDVLGRSTMCELKNGSVAPVKGSKIFKGNRKNGTYEEWSSMDPHSLTLRTERKGGKDNGMTEKWDGNGNLIYKGRYKRGTKEGKHMSFRPDGFVLSEATYKDDFPIGDVVEYHNNGQLANKGHYNKAGRRDGEFTKYDENGNVIFHANYVDGFLVGERISVEGSNRDVTFGELEESDGFYYHIIREGSPKSPISSYTKIDKTTRKPSESIHIHRKPARLFGLIKAKVDYVSLKFNGENIVIDSSGKVLEVSNKNIDVVASGNGIIVNVVENDSNVATAYYFEKGKLKTVDGSSATKEQIAHAKEIGLHESAQDILSHAKERAKEIYDNIMSSSEKVFGNRAEYQIGEQMKEGSEAWQRAAETVISLLENSGINVVRLSNEQLNNLIATNPKLKSLETEEGTIYGWTDGKNIYLTEAGINPNTPIHEYTHIWARAMMKQNPKGWNSIKGLLKGTDIWDEVINDPNYSNIKNNEDAVASEALSRLSGSQNAAKMEQMAQQMIDEAKGTGQKLKARGLIQNIKDALNKFWSWVGKHFFEIENFNSIDEVTDRVLYDLVNQTDLGELAEGRTEYSKKSYGKGKGYGQKNNFTQEFLDDVYDRVLSKYHFEKASSPYVYMNGYIMRIDVPSTEDLKRYRNIDKTDGFGIRSATFVGNITEKQFNEVVDEYEQGVSRTPRGISELAETYSEVGGDSINSDNVNIEDSETDINNDRLHRQTQSQKESAKQGTFVKSSNSYLRASRIDSGISLASSVGTFHHSGILAKLYAEYMDAVERGKKVRAENIVEDAAAQTGYTEEVYHGTPRYGFTEFESHRPSGAIFTTTARNTAANYGGDGKYASVRRINKGLKEVKSTQDVLDNAKSRFDQDWRLATQQERDATILRVETEAKSVLEKIQELDTNLSNLPANVQESLSWMADMIYTAAEGRQNGNEGNALSNLLKDGYKRFKESREFARQWIREHYNELTPEQERYWSYINGFKVGDIAIEAGYSMAQAVSDSEIATVDGKSFLFIDDLNERTQEDKNVGTYKLFGNLGSNPLVIEAGKKNWFDLDFNGMKTTDSIAEWAKENGYTSVVFKNIYDYGDLSDVKVFFDSSQLKSADPITYDNEGNIIPLSERFNLEENDIRYRKADAQNAAVDYLVGDSRNEVIERAVNEEASKLGVKVTFKTREQMEKGHENDKGYYNTKTGEIVICTENNASISDAIQTILHEAVAHKGLRQLMGDKFNQFIDRVYNSLDAKTKAEVDALAEKEYDGNTAVAMEEYMAKLAESENFSEQTIWEKIKTIFNNIINTLLGRNDIKLGDSELRYLLGASYNNMVNPNGMMTLEGWAKDMLMRENYGINEVNTATPDILSRTGIDVTEVSRETAKQVYDRVVNENWQEVQRQFQDAYQPVRIAIDAIQQETGNVPIEDYENYLLIQNQASSRSRVETDNFKRQYYTPILDSIDAIINSLIEARGLKNNKANRAELYKEVRQYLIAKHGLERNKYYQEHKEEYRDYSGLTSLFGLDSSEVEAAEEEAMALVDEFESSLGRTNNEDGEMISQGELVEALWNKINAATDKTLRHSYECGIISRQQYNDIKSMFEFYIPLRGFDETTAEDVYSYARFEGNRFNPAVKTAEGRTSLADDPIATIMNMAESEIAQGNKNRAKQALYSYLLNRNVTDENGNQQQNSLMQIESVWYVKSKDAEGNEVYQIAAPNHDAGETYEEFEQRMADMAADGEAFKSEKGKVNVGMRFQQPSNANAHYIYLKVNGVEKAIYVNGDPKAANAINGKYPKKDPATFAKMRNLNRLISSTFTNYSLEFTVRNLFRDAIYSRVNVFVKESDPAYRKKFRRNWRHNLFTMIGMISKYKSGKFDNAELNENEAMFVEFMENGGQTGYTLINSVENHKKELEKSLERMRKGKKNSIKNSSKFMVLLNGIELLNEASELVTRFAAYKTSREMGRGVVSSVNDAKEISVNFNTKGAQDGDGALGLISRYLGAAKYFFNASVQGVQNLNAMMKKGKGKFCGVACGTMAFGALMPMINSALAGMLGYGDDDEYWNIPEYDRQNNICIMTGGGKYIKIPLPIGFREMFGIGDIIAAGLYDKRFDRDMLSVAADIANKIGSIVLPVNPLEGPANELSFVESAVTFLAPDAADFAVQSLINKDFKGDPLQKEYGYNEHDPEWTKAFANNPSWLKGACKWLYEVCPHIDWSPEHIDNGLSNLFGGIYSLTKKTANVIDKIWNYEEFKTSEIPVVGVVFGEGADDNGRYLNSAYWEMNDYYEERVAEVKRVAKAFGYTLDDVYKRVPEGKPRVGEHHPEMSKIYNDSYFDFDWMQEWYLGNNGETTVKHGAKVKTDGLSQIKNDIKKLEKEINGNKDGMPTKKQEKDLAKLTTKYNEMFESFVNDMMELD